MYTPPQWRIAAPAVGLVVAVALGYALNAHDGAVAGASAGLIVGLFCAIAWTMRALFPPAAAVFVAAAAAVVIGLFLAHAPGLIIALLVGLVVCLVWIGFYHVWFTGRLQRERVSPMQTFGEGGSPRALIVYHSAHQGFQRAMQQRLAEALAAKGWRVDLSTASRQAPEDIAPYALLVLGAPAFNGYPARAVVAYLRRLGALGGKPVALVVSGGGITADAMRRLRRAAEASGARVVESLELWTRRPNPERFGATEPEDIIRGLGAALAERAS